MQPVAQILIGYLPNGQIVCKANIPNPQIGVMMCEWAKLELHRQLTGPPPPPASVIEYPPTGLRAEDIPVG